MTPEQFRDLEKKATGPVWRPDSFNNVQVVWDRPVGEEQMVVIHHVCFAHDREFLCTMRNVSPLFIKLWESAKVAHTAFEANPTSYSTTTAISDLWNVLAELEGHKQ